MDQQAFGGGYDCVNAILVAIVIWDVIKKIMSKFLDKIMKKINKISLENEINDREHGNLTLIFCYQCSRTQNILVR